MRIVAIVPIKLNNERLPGKNTKLLGGVPLIVYCLKTLLDVKTISEIYVYCSTQEIVQFLPEGVSFLKRPQYLDLPESNFTQIFTEFRNSVPSDVYVYAHATAPFIKTDTVKRALHAVLSGQFDSAFCAEKIQDFLWQDHSPLNFDQHNLPRSQDLPLVYRETSGVYVFTKNVFDLNNSRIGAKPCIIEVTRKESVDINTEEDFHFAEIMLNADL